MRSKKSRHDLDFDKNLGREQLPATQQVIKAGGRFARSYNPNYKLVESRKGMSCLPFSKIPGRTFKYELMSDSSSYHAVLENVIKNQHNKNGGSK